MKKSSGIVGVIAIVAAAYVGATWYVGKEAQATVERVVARTNERLADMLGADKAQGALRVEITDYDRRLFSSDVNYTFHMLDNDGEPVQWKLHDRLDHGPLPVNAVKSGEFMPMLAYSQTRLVVTPATKVWFDSQQGAAPLHARTHIGFGGNGKSVWTIEPTQLGLDGDSLSFSGATLSMDFSNDFKDNRTQGGFESFALVDEETGETLQIGKVQLDSSTVNGQDGSSRAESTASIQAFVLDSGSAKALTFSDMAISLNSEQTGRLLDGTLRYDFGSVKLGDIELGAVSIGGKVNKLDVAALTDMATEYDAIVARHDAQGDDPLDLSDAEQAAIREKLAAVLKTEPSLLIDPILWKNDKGESTASLFVQLAAPASGEADVGLLATEIARQVKLELTLSRTMLVQAFSQMQSDPQERKQMEMMGGMIYDQYTARLQRVGLIEVQGDTATLALVYENESVDVNGQKMATDEFLQKALSVAM